MKSTCLPEYWEYYHKLPLQIAKLADKNYRLFQTNPQHPSLHFKPVGDDFWSVRIGIHYRALGMREGDEMVWVWIGSHSEYDQIIAK